MEYLDIDINFVETENYFLLHCSFPFSRRASYKYTGTKTNLGETKKTVYSITMPAYNVPIGKLTKVQFMGDREPV